MNQHKPLFQNGRKKEKKRKDAKRVDQDTIVSAINSTNEQNSAYQNDRVERVEKEAGPDIKQRRAIPSYRKLKTVSKSGTSRPG